MTPLRIPLAPAQRGLYFLHRLAPHSPVYNVPIALHVRGPLDLDRLRRALDALIVRHQALRTTINDSDDVVQVIHPAAEAPPVAPRHTRGTGIDRTDRWAWATREAARRASEPFDLRHGPLWRADVIEIDDDDFALVFSFHHIIIDEVSAAVLGRELRIAYTDPGLLDRPVVGREYADFCLVQQARAPAERLDYWRGQLAGLEAPPLGAHMATDDWLFIGERIKFQLAPTELAALEQTCRTERVTQFMAFYAVLLVLLRRWTGQSDLAVGTPLSGRTDPRFEQTVGFFQNTVVLRTAVSDDLTFRKLLRLVRRTVLEAVEHQDVPFSAVVEATRPARSATRNPLFQVALVYNRTKVEDDWLLDGLTVDPLPFDWQTSHFDLALSLNQHRGTVHGELAFSDRRFDRSTMSELATAYQELLHDMVADVDRQPMRHQLRVTLPAPASAPTHSVPSEGLAPSTVPAPQGPATDDLEARLIGIFEETLGVPGIEREDNFFELGGHSLLAVTLVCRVVDELGLPLTVGEFMNHASAAQLAQQLNAGIGDRSCLVRLREGDCGTTVVFVHPVGGTLFCYQELIRCLPPGPTVVGLERTPGLHPHEASIIALADRYATAVAQLGSDRLVLVGWSLGGVLAHALAGRLLKIGAKVEHVILLDAFAGHEDHDRDQLVSSAGQLTALVERVRAGGPSVVLEGKWEDSTLRRFGVDIGQFRAVEPSHVADLLEGWAGMLSMVSRYGFAPVLARATLLTAADNPVGYPEAISESWIGRTGPLQVSVVPGDHFSMLAPPAVRAVGDHIAQAVASAYEVVP